MAKTNWQDPKTSEVRSTHISGLQEAVGKIEESIGIESIAETNIPLSEVYIAEADRYRIFQAPEGKRNWLNSPAPVIKKNGSTITNDFEIDYGGGAIVFTTPVLGTDTLTADVTYTKKVEGKGLSTNDYTAAEKNKLAGIEADFEVHKADGTQHKKTARFVIGTSTAGWTSKDVDYLCDGTADQTEINAAITALPATGGEVVILDGAYNITAKIDVTKDNVSIKGNGNATILKRMYNSSVKEGVITLTSRSGCKIANLQIEGNKTSYTNSNNCDIYLGSSSNNTITSNACNNSNCGIFLSDSSSSNTVTGNTCNNNFFGIYLSFSSNNTITSNTCNNNDAGIQLGSSSNNTITSNACNNSNYGIFLSDSSSSNTVTGNTYYSNNCGIYLGSSSNNTITSNTCNNNSYGIYLNSSNRNTVTGNTCIRGTGLATDYTESQHTIRLKGTGNSYNLIAMNNCMGKAVTNEGGTGNTLVNNKFDAT